MDVGLGGAGSSGRGGGGGRSGSGGGRDSPFALGGGGASAAAWTRLVSSGVEDELVAASGGRGGGGGRAGARAGGLPQGHFLDACFLCRKPLPSNRDIFMYRFAPLPPLVLLYVSWEECIFFKKKKSAAGPVLWTFPTFLEGVFFLARTGNLTAGSSAGKVIK
jgi:hypothetical protein